MAHPVLPRTSDRGWARGDNDPVAGVRLVRQTRPRICACAFRRSGADETNQGCHVRKSAPSPILTRGGRAAGGVKGAKVPETVLEGDTGAFSEPDHCLPSSTLFHTTKRPGDIEAAGSQVLASRSLCSSKPIAAYPSSPTVQGSHLYKCWPPEIPYRCIWTVEYIVMSARTYRLRVVLNSTALIRSDRCISAIYAL